MSDEIQRLVTVFDADFKKLDDKLDRALKKHQDTARKIDKTWDGKLFGDPGKALDKIFDSSRLKVLDSGIARIGLFGSALETLGPAGIVAAGAIGVVFAALNQARGAAKFADTIQDTAARLHVTTDALQEFRYATFQAGGTMEGADAALEAFSVNVGKAQEGLKKSQRAFLALGFTKEQIASFTSADDALKQVTARIAELKSDPQKDALIDQLGLTGMKPLILQGVSAMEELRQKAHAIGIVMDADLISRGAEANKQFEVLAQVVDVQLKSAFVDLAPVLVDLMKFAAQFAREINNVSDALHSVENRTTSGLVRQRESVMKDLGDLVSGKTPVPGMFRQAYIDKRLQQLSAINGALSAPDRFAPAPTLPHGSRSLIDQGSHPKAKVDHSQDEVDKAVLAALEKQLQATISETGTIQDHLDTDLTILGLKRAERDRELDRQVAEGKLSKAQAAQIKEAEHAAQGAEENNLKLDAFRKKQDVADEYQSAIVGYMLERLRAEESLATTAKDRRRLALEAYDAERTSARVALEKSLRRNPDLTPEQRANEVGQFDRNTATGRAAVEQDHDGPIQRYLREIQDLDTTMQEAAVNGAKSLSSGLAEAIVNAQSLGDVAKNVFKQMIADLIAAQLEKRVFGPILGSLAAIGPGHAAGGWIGGSGGPTSDSNLTPTSTGEFVVNAAAASRNGPVLEAINSGRDFDRMPAGMLAAGGGESRMRVEVTPSPYFDVRVREVSAPVAQRYAHAAGQASRAASRSDAERSRRQTIR